MSFQPNNAFEETFRQFLQEPETQDAIRGDQEKEIKVMKKMDEFEALHELTGQREQLAVALQDLDAESQRLIYPILRLKMVQHILFAALKASHFASVTTSIMPADMRHSRALHTARACMHHLRWSGSPPIASTQTSSSSIAFSVAVFSEAPTNTFLVRASLNTCESVWKQTTSLQPQKAHVWLANICLLQAIVDGRSFAETPAQPAWLTSCTMSPSPASLRYTSPSS